MVHKGFIHEKTRLAIWLEVKTKRTFITCKHANKTISIKTQAKLVMSKK